MVISELIASKKGSRGPEKNNREKCMGCINSFEKDWKWEMARGLCCPRNDKSVQSNIQRNTDNEKTLCSFPAFRDTVCL